MTSFFAAIQFLTRLPVPSFSWNERHIQRSSYFYSLTGLGLGAVFALFNVVTARWVPLPGRIVFILCISAAMTGGLHLDGLADTVDGLFGGRDRERRLAIMRDSRIGTFGVLGLLGILSLQFTALQELPHSGLNAALFLAPGWGRASIVLAAAITPSARTEGLGSSFMNGVRLRHAMTCFAVVSAFSLVVSPWMTLFNCVATIAVTLLLSWYLRIRIGGQTGDTLGATNELVETAVFWTYVIVGSRQ